MFGTFGLTLALAGWLAGGRAPIERVYGLLGYVYVPVAALCFGGTYGLAFRLAIYYKVLRVTNETEGVVRSVLMLTVSGLIFIAVMIVLVNLGVPPQPGPSLRLIGEISELLNRVR